VIESAALINPTHARKRAGDPPQMDDRNRVTMIRRMAKTSGQDSERLWKIPARDVGYRRARHFGYI